MPAIVASRQSKLWPPVKIWQIQPWSKVTKTRIPHCHWSPQITWKNHVHPTTRGNDRWTSEKCAHKITWNKHAILFALSVLISEKIHDQSTYLYYGNLSYDVELRPIGNP